uniref:Uncharacterized protein n=1 Tax=Clytia hemisphaerica TaxID=252671 RepID=A0A7M5XEL3_9CNID
MSDPNALGGKVHPTNQGDAPTCTRHAIAKAIVQHAHYHKRYDFNQDYVLGVVENFKLTLEAVLPSEYDGEQFHFMDRTYHPEGLNKHYTITTKVANIPVLWDEALRQLKKRQRILEEERKAEEKRQRTLDEEARKAEEQNEKILKEKGKAQDELKGEQTRLQMKNNEEKKSYNGVENTTSVLLKKIFTFALIPPFAAFLLVLPKPGIVWAMSGVGALFVLGVNLLTEAADSSITKEDVDEALLLSTTPPGEKEAKNEDYDRAAPPGGRPNFHLEYVLVYDTSRTDAHSSHCVFIKSIKDGNFNCINSWRDIDPAPQVRIGKEKNRLWRVNVEYKDPEIK